MNPLMGMDLNVVQFFTALDSSSMDLVPQFVALRGPVEEYVNATSPFVDPDSEPVWTAAIGAGLTDLAVQSDVDNLAQALVLRLITPVGALAVVGHSGYGSRLGQLIGQNKTETLRNLCRTYVLEAIGKEPRVEPTAVAFDFDLLAETNSDFRFTLVVQPVQGGNPLSLGLSVTL